MDLAAFPKPIKQVLRSARYHLPQHLQAKIVPPLPVTPLWPGIAQKTNKQSRRDTFSAIVGPGKGRKLLDLGAGPGLFAKRARNAGWSVTAVDGRTERLLDDLHDITFIEADVRNFDVTGYHTIAILGLLYHLTLDQQISLLRSCSYARVILETQVHVPGHVPPAAEPWAWEMVTEDGLQGVHFPEQTHMATASIDNRSSFWATEPSLLEMFRRTGYESVQTVEPMHHSKYGPRRYYLLNS